jgi:hypothetical protein
MRTVVPEIAGECNSGVSGDRKPAGTAASAIKGYLSQRDKPLEPQRIRSPSATCRVDGATREGNALKVIGECGSVISYSNRTVYVTLRSDNELSYSPTGDPVLATLLKRCRL